MSKIICDVCGTAYPETADLCPICGSARPASAAGNASDATGSEGGRSYTYVKGGRFSKSNVRKRNKANAANRFSESDDDDLAYQEPPSNKGLILAIILLLIAIAAVIIYIFLTFTSTEDGFAPSQNIPTATTTQPTATESSPETTVAPTTTVDLSCVGLTLESESVVLTQVGEVYLLNVMVTPEDTEDTLSYSSSDPSVAEVSEEGRVTAVASGEAVITVTCGEITVSCTVTCQLPPEGPDPNAQYAVYIDGKDAEQRKYKNEVTLNRKQGNSFKLELYNKDTGEVVDVEWVSGDDAVCTVEGNIVQYVGSGSTEVTVTIGEKTYRCKVLCS